MIKLRGYSVVPGKVEKAITDFLAVSQALVVAHGEGLDKQLVAYVVREKAESDSRARIEIEESGHSPSARKTLSQYLAQYMLPALWVELEEIPTHEVSGKTDMKALPPPPDPKAQNAATTGKKEKDPIGLDQIAEIWAATLHTSRNLITPDHSFFDLGGHSLSLAELASRFSRNFGFRVPVARLADPPTLTGHL
ncbi:hypothetical protein KC317_g23547, partial [Hortaea werneckii]